MQLPRLDQTAAWLLALLAAASVAAFFYYSGSFLASKVREERENIDLEKEKTRLFPLSSKENLTPLPAETLRTSPKETTEIPAARAKQPARTQKLGQEPGDDFLLSNALLWSYKGKTAPSQWASLKPEFSSCGSPSGQSPIDLRPASKSPQIPKLEFFFGEQSLQLAHQGQLVLLFSKDSSPGFLGLTVDGDRYFFKYALLHTPSEHPVAGVSFDAEIQLVFQNTTRQMAAVAILYEETRQPSPVFQTLLKYLPKKNEVDQTALDLTLQDFLPPGQISADLKYYSYVQGSLTVPPCTPGVQWFVLANPLNIGAGQVDALAKKIGFNRRSLKTRGSRRVLFTP